MKKKLEDLCLWKEVYENNLKGKGTSFSNKYILKQRGETCGKCQGYDIECITYQEKDVHRYLRRTKDGI